MNIGDRVRTLKSNHEGIITKLISENQIEVEIEDGFRIPFLKADLVVVAREEHSIWGDDKAAASGKDKKAPPVSEKGLYLAITHFNDKQLEVNLVNNTDFAIPYIFGDDRDMGYFGISGGVLSPRSFQKVHELNLDKFERWDALIIQFLFHRLGVGTYREPIVKKMRFKAQTFFKSLKEVPIMRREGYLFQLDEEFRSLDAKNLSDKTDRVTDKPIEGQPAKQQPITPQKPTQLGKKKQIDLHAEKLGIQKLNQEEILLEQLRVFENELDKAIFEGYDEIIFIHGVGLGTLKKEIQKRLSRHPHIAFYQDAQKEKFGYGATLAKIK
ncbi:MAG: DUF2027 domain-containing protein [Flammeovirgaceae bacterium]